MTWPFTVPSKMNIQTWPGHLQSPQKCKHKRNLAIYSFIKNAHTNVTWPFTSHKNVHTDVTWPLIVSTKLHTKSSLEYFEPQNLNKCTWKNTIWYYKWFLNNSWIAMRSKYLSLSPWAKHKETQYKFAWDSKRNKEVIFTTRERIFTKCISLRKNSLKS